MNAHTRLAREKQTIKLMVEMYCQARHQSKEKLCNSCSQLLEYAFQKITICPFGELKPVCANCRIHCYKGEMRAMVKAIMKYSGRRMMFRHPILALLHLLDSMKKQNESVIRKQKK